MGRRFLAILFVTWVGPAQADFDAEEFPPYERCALCHGLFGISATDRFPKLAGQEPLYVENQINAFLEGSRHNDGGQMVDIVSELKPEEIPVVIEWFSTQEPPEPALESSALGKSLYEAAMCKSCHDTGNGYLGVPHLTSQHAGYLAKQMKDFRDGRRDTHLGCLPHGALMPADDAEIDAIAAHLASVPRP